MASPENFSVDADIVEEIRNAQDFNDVRQNLKIVAKFAEWAKQVKPSFSEELARGLEDLAQNGVMPGGDFENDANEEFPDFQADVLMAPVTDPGDAGSFAPEQSPRSLGGTSGDSGPGDGSSTQD